MKPREPGSGKESKGHLLLGFEGRLGEETGGGWEWVKGEMHPQ